ncbi:MAG: ABC transporter ATP-binding protein [Caldilineaceae bacterium]
MTLQTNRSSEPLWLFGQRPSAEEEERRIRENKVQGLLRGDDDDKLGKVYDARLVRRIAYYIKPYQVRLYISMVLMTISALLYAAAPWIIGKAVDDGIRAGLLPTLRQWTWILLIAVVGEAVSSRTRITLMAIVGTSVVADIRAHLYKHLHALPMHFHNNYSVGRMISRLVSDVDVLLDFTTWSITGLARSVFILLGIAVAMLAMNWLLALVCFAVLPLMVILTNYWRTRVREAYRATRKRLSLINGYLNESITGIRVTKSFAREPENAQHFADLNRSFFDANVEAAQLAAIFFPGVDLLGSLSLALVVGVGGWLVTRNALSAGELVAFAIYVDRFYDPIRELAQRYNTFQSTMAASERLFGLIDTPATVTDRVDAIPLPPIQGEVLFDQVDFAYTEKEPVLQHVSIHAAPGDRIALVGETGAGKSTIIRLLSRFYDVTGGAVKIDGHDVRAVTLASLRSQIGVVLQDTFLFGGTIQENIRYGKLDASDEEIIAAAQAVGADEFITRLPNGYQTDVGENGVNLSVGQRQIISFARALLADPKILVLDEATSSVDTATERIIQAALDRLMEGRTSFVIAHRLSTIVNADKIVVMEHGQVLEEGSHLELLAKRGKYYNLYTMQWAEEGTR